MALREGIAAVPAAVEDARQVDSLADIAAVLGEAKRMPTQEVLHRLVEHDPDRYREWTTGSRTKFLTPLGAAPYKSGGTMQVSSARVREAITERDDTAGAEDAAGRETE